MLAVDIASVLLIVSLALIPLWVWFTHVYKGWIRDFEPSEIDTLPFTWDELEAEIAAGNVSVRPHPDDKALRIYNYTAQAQYARTWNKVTEACRGLIIKNSKVKARPFAKFFNLGEVTTLPDGPFIATEKEDGSLGIGYMAPDGRPAIATRGSFESDQAVWATNWLRGNIEHEQFVRDCIKKRITPLFEIVYPEYSIVLDYGDRRDLILLATIRNKTGMDVDPPKKAKWYGSRPVKHENVTVDELAAMDPENKEGFVLLFPNGTRIKYKFDQYVELHRILTGLTTRKIWEMVSQNIGVERAKEWVPDEFYVWMKGVADDLRRQFTAIEKEALAVYAQVPRLTEGDETTGEPRVTRKEQAEFILARPHSGIVFKMLDGKEYRDQIWKLVYPEADTAKVRDEAS